MKDLFIVDEAGEVSDEHFAALRARAEARSGMFFKYDGTAEAWKQIVGSDGIDRSNTFLEWLWFMFIWVLSSIFFLAVSVVAAYFTLSFFV